MTTDFTHLHNHGEYSILDGYTRVEDVPKVASELGHNAVALTDHGSLSGSLKFWKAARTYEIKPIQGMEGYICPDISQKDKDSPTWHLVLLAQNQHGLDNLRAISEIGWTKGFYKKPRIDYGILERYNEGIIALSACMAGETARAIENGDIDEAKMALDRYSSILPGRFYVELQPGNDQELNNTLGNLAADCGLPLVVTVDSHYDLRENKAVAEALLLMQQSSGFKDSIKNYARLMYDEAAKEEDLIKRLNILWPERYLRFDKHELHMMSRAEVVERMTRQGFDGTALADTTLEIAERCEGSSFRVGVNYLPKITQEDSSERLRKDVYAGLRERGLEDIPQYVERAEEELAVIKDKNFDDYFLIVADIIGEARRRNIYVGPGRGSAAGSLVAYALRITALDPIKYKLLFFRFINAERNDFPDIDMDFEHTRRDEMKDYVREKYGEALSLSTFTTMKAKGVVKAICRILAIPLDEAEKVTKHFNDLDEYELGEADQLKTFRARHPEVLPLAKKLIGHISAGGMHPAGVVVANRPMHQIVPIESRTDPEDKKNRVTVCGYDMNDSEEVGLIKFDFLGLDCLTVMHSCIDMIKERHGIDIDWENLDPSDPDVLASLNGANTVGVFQMESSPYRKLLREMGVDGFEDLVASNALVRPGAYLTVKNDYVKRKKGQEKVTYPHDNVIVWLEDTYGTYIYQEQVMALAVELGDFSWSEADRLRKIIGKKKDVEEFAPFYAKWLANAGNKIGEKEADKIWRDFEKHAGYSFNRSHSVCYGYLGYVTAWLKYYYPLEYLFALLKTEKKDTARMTYLLDAKRSGVELLPPDVNKSEKDTSIDGNGIRFGLGDVLNVGFTACDELIAKRPFTSWEDFTDRITARKCNSRVVESLVCVNALASIPDAPHLSDPEKNYQKYLSYPIAMQDMVELPFETTDIGDIEDIDEGDFYLVSAIAKSIKKTDRYVRLELEDMTGSTTVFGAMNNDLSDGEVVIALIGDKTMVGYTRLHGLAERLKSGNTTDFERFLAGEIFKEVEQCYAWGMGSIDNEKSLVVPLQVREVTTKTGAQMAFCYMTDGSHIIKVTVFPKVWPKLRTELVDWVPICARFSRLKDGGYTLNNGSVINARKLIEQQKEKIK
jgi:DNA polymerase-3 subunit alpha